MHLRQKKNILSKWKNATNVASNNIICEASKNLEIITENSRTTFLYSCLFDNSTVCEGWSSKAQLKTGSSEQHLGLRTNLNKLLYIRVNRATDECLRCVTMIPLQFTAQNKYLQLFNCKEAETSYSLSTIISKLSDSNFQDDPNSDPKRCKKPVMHAGIKISHLSKQ